jgi:hypothetical protein
LSGLKTGAQDAVCRVMVTAQCLPRKVHHAMFTT